jgi:glucan-binding YG repeat protein
MRKKVILTLFLAGVIGIAVPGPRTDAAWKSDANGRYYTTKSGYASGWKTIGKYRFYFKSDKYAATGWNYIDKNWYYFDTRGRMVKNTWVDTSYLGSDGKMVTSTVVDGIQIDKNGNRVNTSTTDSASSSTTPKNTWVSKNGNWYYYNYKGKLATGLLTIKNTTYYLDPSTGARLGGVILINKKYYYFDPQTGVQKTGYIVLDDGTAYYFSKKTKAALTGWQKISKKYYYFNSKGVLQRNCWIGSKYYVDQLGRRCYGLTTVNGKTYYLNEKTGIKTTGSVKIGNYYYFFNSKGVMVTNAWRRNRYYQANGRMATKKWINNKYVNASGYVTKTKSAGFFTENSKTYYIRKDLTMAKDGWEEIGEQWYYFKSTGVLLKEAWQDGYYVDNEGVRVLNRFYTIGSSTYLFQEDGSIAKGLVDYEGNRYYLDNDTGAVKTGFYLIDGVNYYFQPSSGAMAKDTVLTIGDSVYSFDATGAATLDASGYALGRAIAEYAQKFVGYPYAYGGATDLTKGVDCSGFTKLVFAYFGINIPRTSQAQALGSASKESGGPFAEVKYVSEKELLPGDIIGYYYTAPTHVAIYIGNGKVVHASNSQPYPQGGIKISDYDLGNPANITKIMRYW